MADGDINAGGAVVAIKLQNDAKNGQQLNAIKNDIRMVQSITKQYSTTNTTEINRVSQVWNRVTNVINSSASSIYGRIADIIEKTTMFGANLTQIGSTVKRAGDYIGRNLGDALDHFAARGDVFSKLADKTGASAEALSAIGYAAEQSGGSVDALRVAIIKMQDNIANAAKGRKGADSVDGGGKTVGRVRRLRGGARPGNPPVSRFPFCRCFPAAPERRRRT